MLNNHVITELIEAGVELHINLGNVGTVINFLILVIICFMLKTCSVMESCDYRCLVNNAVCETCAQDTQE